MTEKANKNYRLMRSRLYLAGHSFRSFARQHGFPERSVYSAARGERAGVKSVRILRKLEEVLSDAA
jgi:hypothetical protein